MIIDAHYHLEDELEPVDALLEQMEKHHVERVALIPRMNEPFHLKPIPKMAGTLLPRLLMGRLRFFGRLLYNSTVTSDGMLSTLGTKYLLYHEPDNAYIDRILQKYPDKVLWLDICQSEDHESNGRTGTIGWQAGLDWCENTPILAQLPHRPVR